MVIPKLTKVHVGDWLPPYKLTTFCTGLKKQEGIPSLGTKIIRPYLVEVDGKTKKKKKGIRGKQAVKSADTSTMWFKATVIASTARSYTVKFEDGTTEPVRANGRHRYVLASTLEAEQAWFDLSETTVTDRAQQIRDLQAEGAFVFVPPLDYSELRDAHPFRMFKLWPYKKHEEVPEICKWRFMGNYMDPGSNQGDSAAWAQETPENAPHVSALTMGVLWMTEKEHKLLQPIGMRWPQAYFDLHIRALKRMYAARKSGFRVLDEVYNALDVVYYKNVEDGVVTAMTPRQVKAENKRRADSLCGDDAINDLQKTVDAMVAKVGELPVALKRALDRHITAMARLVREEEADVEQITRLEKDFEHHRIANSICEYTGVDVRELVKEVKKTAKAAEVATTARAERAAQVARDEAAMAESKATAESKAMAESKATAKKAAVEVATAARAERAAQAARGAAKEAMKKRVGSAVRKAKKEMEKKKKSRQNKRAARQALLEQKQKEKEKKKEKHAATTPTTATATAAATATLDPTARTAKRKHVPPPQPSVEAEKDGEEPVVPEKRARDKGSDGEETEEEGMDEGPAPAFDASASDDDEEEGEVPGVAKTSQHAARCPAVHFRWTVLNKEMMTFLSTLKNGDIFHSKALTTAVHSCTGSSRLNGINYRLRRMIKLGWLTRSRASVNKRYDFCITASGVRGIANEMRGRGTGIVVEDVTTPSTEDMTTSSAEDVTTPSAEDVTTSSAEDGDDEDEDHAHWAAALDKHLSLYTTAEIISSATVGRALRRERVPCTDAYPYFTLAEMSEAGWMTRVEGGNEFNSNYQLTVAGFQHFQRVRMRTRAEELAAQKKEEEGGGSDSDDDGGSCSGSSSVSEEEGGEDEEGEEGGGSGGEDSSAVPLYFRKCLLFMGNNSDDDDDDDDDDSDSGGDE